MLIFQPGLSHYYRCDSPYKAHRYLALGGELLPTMLQACGLESAVVIQPSAPDQVNQRLRAIQKLLSKPSMDSDRYASELAFGLLLQLSEVGVATPPAAVQRAIGFLHLNLDRKVSVQDVSLNAGLSRSQLHAQFVRSFALSPLRYQRRMRMESAKNLLLHPAKSIKEVAAQLGYSDQLCFSRDFKKYAGVSPRGFRKGFAALPQSSFTPAQSGPLAGRTQ